MRCWHIHRPMTPVPIQPTRVVPDSALLIAMSSLAPVRVVVVHASWYFPSPAGIDKPPPGLVRPARRCHHEDREKTKEKPADDCSRHPAAASADRPGPRPARV